MGGFMQPQGHVQILVNVLNYGMDPQRALDCPRFCIQSGSAVDEGLVLIEDGTDTSVVEELKVRGHNLKYVTGAERMHFGRGQMIQRHTETGVLWAASDGRADGAAVGF